MSMIESSTSSGHHDADDEEDLTRGTNKQIETRTNEQDDGQPVQVLHGAAIEVEVVDAAIGVACAGLDEGALVGVGNLVAARVDWIVRHRSSSSIHHQPPKPTRPVSTTRRWRYEGREFGTIKRDSNLRRGAATIEGASSDSASMKATMATRLASLIHVRCRFCSRASMRAASCRLISSMPSIECVGVDDGDVV